MKRFIGLVVAAALVFGIGARPAQARSSSSQARWEAAAMALGAIGVIALLGDVVHAQPVAMAVGAGDPGYPAPGCCPPAPPPVLPTPFAPVPPAGRVWVPGHRVDVRVWVPGIAVSTSWVGDCRDRADPGRWRGRDGRHRHDGCGPDGWSGREARGHYERRKVWKEGHYR